ncbi:hypothetical protein AVEN_154317-1 [Araneus ventricosus]|uniref:Uncharacterized protein n=1 Tax=Araneus ventricosus TaxID=182803 RepID=A0A4Y2S188_ARAVE|nr:hypothetical protein AVEN_154317-1 [Araneus ventricosus]
MGPIQWNRVSNLECSNPEAKTFLATCPLAVASFMALSFFKPLSMTPGAELYPVFCNLTSNSWKRSAGCLSKFGGHSKTKTVIKILMNQ